MIVELIVVAFGLAATTKAFYLHRNLEATRGRLATSRFLVAAWKDARERALIEAEKERRAVITSHANQSADMLGQFLGQLAEQTALAEKLRKNLEGSQAEKYAAFGMISELKAEVGVLTGQLNVLREEPKRLRTMSHKPAQSTEAQ